MKPPAGVGIAFQLPAPGCVPVNEGFRQNDLAKRMAKAFATKGFCIEGVIKSCQMVWCEVTGFEPATFWSRTVVFFPRKSVIIVQYVI